MVTFSQLCRIKRPKRKMKNKHRLLQLRPQKGVKCLTAQKIMSPRKPNSAKRKYVRVGWFQSRGFKFARKQVGVNAYVTGEIKSPDFSPQKYADLLIRGGRVPDLPGMKYTIVRGHRRSLKGLSYRRQSRSKYGHGFLHLSEEERKKRVYKNFRYQ